MDLGHSFANKQTIKFKNTIQQRNWKDIIAKTFDANTANMHKKLYNKRCNLIRQNSASNLYIYIVDL